jgi:hypothetical protein
MNDSGSFMALSTLPVLRKIGYRAAWAAAASPLAPVLE